MTSLASSASDRLLVQRIRSGDQTAWNELHQRYRGRIAAYIRRRLKDRNSVDDVVQETFIGFQNSLSSYDDGRDLQTWLFTIANHKVTDHLRRNGRYLKNLGGVVGIPDEVKEVVADGRQRAASSLAQSVERREKEAQALGHALREYVAELLAKGQYVRVKALELMYVKGWRNQEVAGYLSLSEQDVANLRFQTKKRLRERLIGTQLSPDLFPELQEG